MDGRSLNHITWIIGALILVVKLYGHSDKALTPTFAAVFIFLVAGWSIISHIRFSGDNRG